MIEIFYKTKRSNIIVLILTILLQSFFVIFNMDTTGALVLLCVTIVVFLYVIKNKKFGNLWQIDAFHIKIFLFAIYCLFTSLWAIDSSIAIERGFTIIQILICMSVFYAYYDYGDNTDNLLLTKVWSSAVVLFYTLYFYGYDFIVATALAGDRLGTEFANINSIAMNCSLGFVIAVFFLLYRNKLYPFIISLPSVIIIAGSGSRKAFILFLLGSGLLLLFKSSSKSKLKTFIMFSILGLALVIGIKLLEDVAIFTTINERMEGLIALFAGEGNVDSSADKRALYIQEGMQQWVKTPFIGLGIGNSYLFNSGRTYTHNNYVELLSCGGVIGFLLYYSIYVYLLRNLWKYRKVNSKLAFLISVVAFTSLVLDYGSVSYYTKDTYFTFLILFLAVKNLKFASYARTQIN